MSSGGLAVLKGYRWEPLGLSVTFDRDERSSGTGRASRVAGARVEIKNHGERPVAIVMRPDGGSFRLVEEAQFSWNPRVRWVGRDEPPAAPRAEHVKVLQPGDSYIEQLDLSLPQWAIRRVAAAEAGTGSDLERIARGAASGSFRLEYVPPTQAERLGLPHAGLIRPARLVSLPFMLLPDE